MSEFVLDETERLAGVPRGAMRVLTLDLLVVDGPSRGARHRLEGGVARVGSGEGAHLRIADRAVSRLHCELEISGDTVTLRDLGSRNGTFVGDARIRDADVQIGAVVRLGGSAFRVERGEEPSFVTISPRTSFGEVVGSSVEMRQAYAVLERVASTASTVLVQGETGTGKDVVARAIHAESPRSKGPFVPVDCGAIPETLFESELFGHVRGAFTGAVGNRVGAFEEASGGTLFLDEIGEMPLALQAKLLRAIESRSIRPVGAPKEIPVDVRIVCATNRKLAQMVNEGTFREDLYYRLAVVEISLPPLRARQDDIPAIAQQLHAKLTGRTTPLPESFVASLVTRPWPGNVRELRNFIERAVALGMTEPGAALAPAQAPSAAQALPSGVDAIVPLHLPLKEARQAWTSAFESVYVRAMLQKTGGNVTRAAELAGVNRRFLQRLVARLGLSREAADLDEDEG